MLQTHHIAQQQVYLHRIIVQATCPKQLSVAV